jgi:O-antigen/teichoic acid export membrane protein
MWIRNAVPFDANCFHLLLVVTIANSLWFMSSVVSMSSNVHQRLALAFVMASLASLLLAAFLTRTFGIAGAAAALLLTDVSMLLMVLRNSMNRLQDTFLQFAIAMFKPPTIWFSLRNRGEARP